MNNSEIMERPAPGDRPAVTVPGNTSGGLHHRLLEWLVPALCVLLLSLQLVGSARRLSQTADESTHLYAGYRYLKCRDFGFGDEHPPLARMVAALPLLRSDLPVNCATTTRDEAWAALDWLYATDFQSVLMRARMAVALFAVALCLLVWTAARRMFGFAAALVAATLLIFDPNLLAHGALVTTDVALTCTLFATVFLFYRWTLHRGLLLLLGVGVLTGLTLVTKQSGTLLVPILGLLAATDVLLLSRGERGRRALRNLGALLLIGAVAFGIIWCAYGLHFTAHPDGAPFHLLDAHRGAMADILIWMRSNHILPEAYVQGLQTARLLARAQGQPIVFLGRLYTTPPWYYFPVNMAIKYTAASLALLLIAMLGARAAFAGRRRELCFLVVPAGFYFLICLTARISSGIRHLLPIVPFLLIFVAAVCTYWAGRVPWARYALVVALALHAASSLHAFPNYLSYANELWGGPARAYKYLPNSDWGEAYYQAKEYLAQHPGERCWLASPYLMDIRPYQLPCRRFVAAGASATPPHVAGASPIPPHVEGTVILSSMYFDQSLALPNAANSWLAPFLQRPPDALLAGSAMLVFRGSFDTTAAAATTQYATALGLIEKGQFDQALQHALLAAIFAPANPDTRFEYCRELVALGAREMARSECRVARALLQEGETDSDSAAGINRAIVAESALDSGDLTRALTFARQGVEKAPQSSTAHRVYCRALQANRLPDQASRECERSQELARSYPPKYGWMGPVPNVTPMGFNPGWGPARLKLIDLMLHALGEE